MPALGLICILELRLSSHMLMARGRGLGGWLSLVTTRRRLSSAECEQPPLSPPRLALCLTPTLHLPVAALQQAQGRRGGNGGSFECVGGGCVRRSLRACLCSGEDRWSSGCLHKLWKVRDSKSAVTSAGVAARARSSSQAGSFWSKDLIRNANTKQLIWCFVP